MRRILALAVVIVTLVCTMVSCFIPQEEPPKVNPDAKSEGTMTHAEYVAAAEDTEVVIEGFVQGKQSWWDNKASVYLQDGTGGYFVYEMTCSEADYAKLTVGTKIKVTGYKTSWAGEIEVDSGSTFEILPGDTYIASAIDVTSILGNKAELLKKQNMFVCFKGMTVKSVSYKNWKPGDEGTPSDDIYVTLTKDGVDYDFCVERYLTDPSTAVYKAVQALAVGDVIDVEGFLYWYETEDSGVVKGGINPHITSVTVK